jgi:hypothetical protein
VPPNSCSRSAASIDHAEAERASDGYRRNQIAVGHHLDAAAILPPVP